MRYSIPAWWVSLAVAVLALVVTAFAPPRQAGALQQQLHHEWGEVLQVDNCAKGWGSLVCDITTSHRSGRWDVTLWPGHIVGKGDHLSQRVDEMGDRYVLWRCKGPACVYDSVCLKSRACAQQVAQAQQPALALRP